MIVYNTTFNIENDILAECIEYLKKSYIPRAAASGFLRTPYLRRILQDETEDATSYSVQFHVKNPETLEYWMQSEGRDLQQELVNRFGAKLVGFSTLLEEIDLESRRKAVSYWVSTPEQS